MKNTKLKCPYCGNDRVLIKADFKNKLRPNAVGMCIKTVYKGIRFLGNSVIKGCGKSFDIDLKREK